MLAWNDTVNPSGTTYNVYRGTQVAGPFVAIVTGLTVLTFTDSVSAGRYCYYITSVNGGGESVPSIAIIVIPATSVGYWEAAVQWDSAPMWDDPATHTWADKSTLVWK